MGLKIDWQLDPKTGVLTPKVTDMDAEERTKKEVTQVFQHVLSTGTDYPTKMKRGITTFWRTEVMQMDKTEFLLNTALGLGIALAVGSLITPVGWAFFATAGLTTIAGFASGSIQEAINYRKGRKGILKTMDRVKIPEKFTFSPEKYKLKKNYSSILKLCDWKTAKPMLKALWKHFSETRYFQGKFLTLNLSLANENLDEIAALFEAGTFKSQKSLQKSASKGIHIYGKKRFDWALKLKKTSYYAAWVHEFTRGWVEIINGLYEEYNKLTDELLKSIHYQFHLTGNHHACSDCACKEELDQLAQLRTRKMNLTMSRRMQRDLGLSSFKGGQTELDMPMTSFQPDIDMHSGVMGGYSSKLKPKKYQQVGEQTMGLADKGPGFVKTWSIGDACTETQVGNVITAALGEFAKTSGGSVVSGGLGGGAGAGIGKLFSWVGRHFTVKIPAKGKMTRVFEIWASGEAFDPSLLMREDCFKEDYLEYTISKLEHYQKKYDGILEKYKNDLARLGEATDGRFPFTSCDHARDILSKHAALFLQLCKFHIHVEYLNIFNHAVQTAAEDLVSNLERKLQPKSNTIAVHHVRPWLSAFTSIEKWLFYYNSVFGEYDPYTKEF